MVVGTGGLGAEFTRALSFEGSTSQTGHLRLLPVCVQGESDFSRYFLTRSVTCADRPLGKPGQEHRWTLLRLPDVPLLQRGVGSLGQTSSSQTPDTFRVCSVVPRTHGEGSRCVSLGRRDRTDRTHTTGGPERTPSGTRPVEVGEVPSSLKDDGNVRPGTTGKWVSWARGSGPAPRVSPVPPDQVRVSGRRTHGLVRSHRTTLESTGEGPRPTHP